MTDPATPAQGPRRWLALLLAMLLSGGVGHAYAGLPRRGLTWLALQLSSAVALALLTVATNGHLALYAGLILVIALGWLAQVVDLLLVPRQRFGKSPLLHVLLLASLSVALSRGGAHALRLFVLEAFKTPSGSMAPTLLPGDHVIVGKLSQTLSDNLPDRGAPIVFAYPNDPALDYVKRVVGLPGDRIETTDGHPFINGWEVPHCLVGALALSTDDGPPREGRLFVEFLSGYAYLTWYEVAAGGHREGPFTVAANEVFVFGDNRHNSFDSRAWNDGAGGGVPSPRIKGRVLSTTFAFDESGTLDLARMGLSLTGHPRLPRAIPQVRAGIESCLANPPSRTRPPPAPMSAE